MNIKGPYTYPCMLHKNNSVIRHTLEKFGYTDYFKNAANEKDQLLCVCSNNAIFGTSEIITRYIALPLNNAYTEFLNDNFIDCEDNEKLFFALAAHRNDTDKFQWFIPDESLDREPVYCEYDSWEDDFYSWNMDDNIFPYMYRKANKEDLIKIFG